MKLKNLLIVLLFWLGLSANMACNRQKKYEDADTTYVCDGYEICPPKYLSNDEDESRFFQLSITTDGNILAKDPVSHDTKEVYSFIPVPDIPCISFVGWISNQRVVINSLVYEVTK